MGGRCAYLPKVSNLNKWDYVTVMKIGDIPVQKARKVGEISIPPVSPSADALYAFLNANNELETIVYYDDKKKKKKQIDINHGHSGLDEAHVHLIDGDTAEMKVRSLSADETQLVQEISEELKVNASRF
jgi:hypothetical protein